VLCLDQMTTECHCVRVLDSKSAGASMKRGRYDD